MSDYLFRLAQRPVAGKLMRRAGLPAPQALARAPAPYAQRFLSGRTVLFGAGAQATAVSELSDILERAGATVHRSDAPQPTPDERFPGLVFDATGMRSCDDLQALYRFFHPLVRQLANNARIVVLADTPASADTLAAAAAARAVEGFVRSLAKEIGRRGATANLLYVEPGAQARLATPVRFLLSDYSTFVDAQPITINAAGCVPQAMPLTQPLRDKVALVTGGARGIGAATAARLAAEGAHVVCVDVPSAQATLEQTVAEFDGTALSLDITAADAAATLTAFMQQHFDGVDIVVHNAGITRDKTLGKMSAQYWDQVMAINLQAVLALDDTMASERLINDHGRIVCLCSIGGIAGNTGQTNYGATKAGLIGFVERRGGQARERGICVNAVAPGFIETRMTAHMPMMVREAGRRLSSLGQGGLPRDVAETITFLATPGAAGISGNVIRVCGQSLIGA